MAGEHDVNANCGWGDLVCAGAEGFINSLFHGVTDSLGGLAKSLGSFWVNTPSIPLTGKDKRSISSASPPPGTSRHYLSSASSLLPGR